MTNPMLEGMQSMVGQSLANSISPTGRWLLGTLTKAEDGDFNVTYTVREDMTNPMAGLHGGIITTMIDDVTGMMVFASTQAFYSTINIAIDFLSGARVGDVLVCNARIVRRGRNIINTEATLAREDGKLIAKATSNMFKIEQGHKPS
jgi:acyl-coenzyme A thioesterase 13